MEKYAEKPGNNRKQTHKSIDQVFSCFYIVSLIIKKNHA